MPLAPVLRGKLIRAVADINLIGDDGECEEVHSVLLMTISPYFQIVLNDNELKNIQIVGANKSILKLIKDYAYEGKINGLTKENVNQVHRVADMYNIVAILNECELFMKNTNIT